MASGSSFVYLHAHAAETKWEEGIVEAVAPFATVCSLLFIVKFYL